MKGRCAVELFPNNPAFYLVLPVAGAGCFLFLFCISLVSDPYSKTVRLFALICLFGALVNGDVALVSAVPDDSLALTIDRYFYTLFPFSLPLYIFFVHAFLDLRNRRIVGAAAAAFGVVFAFLSHRDVFIAGMNHYSFGRIARGGPGFYLFAATAAVIICYCLTVMMLGIKRAQSNEQRNRIIFVLIGMGGATILIAMNILPVVGYSVYPLGNFSFIPAVILAFGVLKYDLFDAKDMIRKSTVYFVLTTFLTAFYVAVVYLFNVFFIDYQDDHPYGLPLVLAVIVVFIFKPLYGKVDDVVQMMFFRGRYAYHRTLREFSATLTTFFKRADIVEYIVATIEAALGVRTVSIIVADTVGGGVITAGRAMGNATSEDVMSAIRDAGDYFNITRRSVNRDACDRRGDNKDLINVFSMMEAALLVPIIGKDRIDGMIALGEKKRGGVFSHEDRELLMIVANQTAIALENARRYETIVRLNTDLERRVEKRTAELRRVLYEKERTQEQLVRSESLATIGQLVAGVAHELNNPLASASSLIESSIEALKEEREPCDETIDDLSFSLTELGRATGIVTSLLGLSRQTVTYEEPVDISEVIDDALRVLYNDYKRRDIVIKREYDEDVPMLEGNFAALGQVFINIIKNALQSKVDGRIIVSLATTYRENDDRIVVECRDTGCGIPREARPHIFKPFYTTKDPGEGTGLGLYIVHEIITRHAGCITVCSNDGQGTTVTVVLPRTRRQS